MIRDRIKELRRVKASDLFPSEKNWRTHPKAQVDALEGILSELGYADALLAREVEQEFRCAEHGNSQTFWRELIGMIEQVIAEK